MKRHVRRVVLRGGELQVVQCPRRVFEAGGDARADVMGVGHGPPLAFALEPAGVLPGGPKREIRDGFPCSATASAERARSSSIWIRISWIRRSMEREYSGQTVFTRSQAASTRPR